jgi:plasmid stabilization system protein ParE
MAFRVEISLKAERDLDRILARLLAEHAGEPGVQWFLGLRKAIATLDEFPTRCPKAPENETSRQEIHHLLYGNKPHIYRVLFTIHHDIVRIIHVRGPRQRPLSIH